MKKQLKRNHFEERNANMKQVGGPNLLKCSFNSSSALVAPFIFSYTVPTVFVYYSGMN